MKQLLKLLAKAEIKGVTYDVGTILRVDKDTATALIEAGAAVDHIDAAVEEAFAKQVAEEVAKQVKAANDKIAKARADDPRVGITTKDTREDDPMFGYGVGKDSYSDAEVGFYTGQFLVDVKAAAGGVISDKLKLCGELSSKRSKAAGIGAEIGSDAHGGFLVPRATSDVLLNMNTLEDSIVRSRATNIQMATQGIDMPAIDDHDHSAGVVFGGVSAKWQGEKQQLSESRPRFESIALKLSPLTALGYWTEEMEKWGTPEIGSTMIPMFRMAIAHQEDDKYLNGTGVGMPKGILQSNCKLTIARTTDNSIEYDDVLNMFARLLVMNENAVGWLANRTIIPALAKMSLTIGTGGAAVFIPANVAAGQRIGSLFGYPIIFTEKVPGLGTESDLSLVDFSQYLVANDVDGDAFAESIHFKFDYRETAFRLTRYADGRCWRRKAFTPMNGDPLSPIMTLTDKA